jgi:predicted nucleotidyltransferase component of viral defense system
LGVGVRKRDTLDIDVVFTDHTLDRETALRAIAADLKDIKSAISAMGHRAVLPTTKSGDEVKLVIAGNGVQVKVEVNFVFRGTVLPVVQLPLVPIAQELFTTDIALPVLDPAELYGGKLVAAMDRQHPRDIFDVLKMIEKLAGRVLPPHPFVTNSFGFSDPSPKKNFSISFTKNARALGSMGVSRFSLMSMV